jgi:hypothetical protein
MIARDAPAMQELLDEIAYDIENGLPPQDENEEEMALSKTDVNKLINEALDNAKPHGWKAFAHWAQKMGSIVGVCAIIIALLGIAAVQFFNANARLAAQATFQTATNGRLDNIEKSITALSAKITGMQLSSLAGARITNQTVKQTIGVVTTAQRDGEKIDPSIVSSAGRNFVEASASQPDAWPAVKTLLDYKSAYNVIPSSFVATYGPPETEPARMFVRYDWPPGFQGEKFWIGYDKKSDIAELRRLGTPDPNAGRGGNALFILRGSTVVLDGMRMKHVVIENALVRYNGGPTSLEGVYFVNCTFDIQPKPTGQMLATAIFSDQAVKFDS